MSAAGMEQAAAHVEVAEEPAAEAAPATGVDASDGIFDFDIPRPPKGTTNYDYEFSVAIWRDRVTCGLRQLHTEVAKDRSADEVRFRQLIGVIKAQNSLLTVAWEAVKACGAGTLELSKVAAAGLLELLQIFARNEGGSLKYVSVIVLGLAAIVNGIAFSGLGFTAESSVKCGQGTELVDGRCVLANDGAGDAAGDVVEQL